MQKRFILIMYLVSILPLASAYANSDYEELNVGRDPYGDDGAINITEDDDSINIHMGGDPNHGIYHNPSQQNEYVYPPEDCHHYSRYCNLDYGGTGRD